MCLKTCSISLASAKPYEVFKIVILAVKAGCEEVSEKNFQEVLTSWSTKLLSKKLIQPDNNDGNQCLRHCSSISIIFQIHFTIFQILRNINIIFE